MKSGNIQKFIKEWNDTLEMYDYLRDEILKITQTIDNEMYKHKNNPEKEFLSELNPWFRIAIRSALATIEAICYKLKKTTILICDQRKKSLTPTEREKLNEKKRGKKGKLRNYYLKSEDNIKFTLKKIFYSFDMVFEIHDLEGWQKLKDTIEIRNRLTHPKYSTDLEVSPQEYNDAVKGFYWFVKHFEQLGKKSLRL